MTENSNHKEVNQIMELIQSYNKATKALDVNAIMPHYADDIVSFDAIGQLQFKGVDAYRKHWQMCVDYMPEGSSMLFEINELNVVANSDVAYGHYLTRCGMKAADGTERATWMRVTFCCRKLGGSWKIAHEHFSVPFDPETNKALSELTP